MTGVPSHRGNRLFLRCSAPPGLLEALLPGRPRDASSPRVRLMCCQEPPGERGEIARSQSNGGRSGLRDRTNACYCAPSQCWDIGLSVSRFERVAGFDDEVTYAAAWWLCAPG